jgi:hypothetical protein
MHRLWQQKHLFTSSISDILGAPGGKGHGKYKAIRFAALRDNQIGESDHTTYGLQ